MKLRRFSKTLTYNTWLDMRRRCYQPSRKAFRDYGGRGIIVCERWRTSFLRFLEDMGQRPVGLVIDRINNDGNYEPVNCRWTTRQESNRNKRNTITRIPFLDGETPQERKKRTVRDWSERNPEKRRQYSRKYHANNRELINERFRKRYPLIRERHLAAGRRNWPRWYAKHRDQKKAHNDAYRLKNLERLREYDRQRYRLGLHGHRKTTMIDEANLQT